MQRKTNAAVRCSVRKLSSTKEPFAKCFVRLVRIEEDEVFQELMKRKFEPKLFTKKRQDWVAEFKASVSSKMESFAITSFKDPHFITILTKYLQTKIQDVNSLHVKNWIRIHPWITDDTPPNTAKDDLLRNRPPRQTRRITREIATSPVNLSSWKTAPGAPDSSSSGSVTIDSATGTMESVTNGRLPDLLEETSPGLVDIVDSKLSTVENSLPCQRDDGKVDDSPDVYERTKIETPAPRYPRVGTSGKRFRMLTTRKTAWRTNTKHFGQLSSRTEGPSCNVINVTEDLYQSAVEEMPASCTNCTNQDVRTHVPGEVGVVNLTVGILRRIFRR